MRKSLFPGLNLFWSNIFFLIYFEELLSWRIILIFEEYQFESVFLRRNPRHLRHHLFISAGIFRNHKIRFEQTKLYTFHLENISRSLSLNGLEELEFLKIPSPSFLNFLFHRIKDALCLTQYNLPSTISPHTRTLVERWPIPKPRFLESNNIFTIIRRERKKEEPKKHGPSKSSRQNIGITRKIYLIFTGLYIQGSRARFILYARRDVGAKDGRKRRGKKACPTRDTCVDTGIVVRNACQIDEWWGTISGLSVKGYPRRHN